MVLMVEAGELELINSGIIFKVLFGSSLVKVMEAFTDLTKLVEAFGLKTMLRYREIQPMRRLYKKQCQRGRVEWEA